MSRYVVLSEAGSDETLLIDKTTLTVSRLQPEEAKAVESLVAAQGMDKFAGLAFALPIGLRSMPSARVYYREETPATA